MNPNDSHDGLRHREAAQGGGGSGEPDGDQPGAGVDEIRQRAAAIASASQSIVAQALSSDSTQFLQNVRQRGGE